MTNDVKVPNFYDGYTHGMRDALEEMENDPKQKRQAAFIKCLLEHLTIANEEILNNETTISNLTSWLKEARSAMEPFRFVGSCGEGRFQTERLAMVDWHTLCKTAKAIDSYLKPTSDETPTPFGYKENIHE